MIRNAQVVDYSELDLVLSSASNQVVGIWILFGVGTSCTLLSKYSIALMATVEFWSQCDKSF